MMPFSPRATCSISRGPGRELNTMSHACATALGLAEPWAPRLTIRARFEALTSYAKMVWPASTRWRHMGVPMLPTPMNPSCIMIPLSGCGLRRDGGVLLYRSPSYAALGEQDEP